MRSSFEKVGGAKINPPLDRKAIQVEATGWMRGLIAEQSIPSLEGIQTYGSGKLQSIKKHMHNPFRKDAVDAWAEFIKLYKPNAEQLVTEKLWFTDVSKYRNSIIKNWDVKGMRFVADLINNTTGTFYSKNEIESKYDVKMTFLCYASLITSLPNIVKTTNFKSKIVYPVIPYKISLLHGKTKIFRLAYREFQLSTKPNHRKSQTKLENKWIRDINCFSLGTMCDIRLVTKNTYLQAFHFRLISRIIST